MPEYDGVLLTDVASERDEIVKIPSGPDGDDTGGAGSFL